MSRFCAFFWENEIFVAERIGVYPRKAGVLIGRVELCTVEATEIYLQRETLVHGGGAARGIVRDIWVEKPAGIIGVALSLASVQRCLLKRLQARVSDLHAGTRAGYVGNAAGRDGELALFASDADAGVVFLH